MSSANYILLLTIINNAKINEQKFGKRGRITTRFI